MSLTRPHEHDDLGSLTIGSVSGLVCAIDTVSWQVSKTNTDIRGACRPGQAMQTVKRQGTLSTKLYSGSSVGNFVSTDMDLTSVLLGGVNAKPNTYSIQLNGSFDKQRLPAIGVSGIAEGIVGQNYAGTAELQIDDTDFVQTLLIASESGTFSDAQVVLSFTLGGKVVTLPVQLDGNTHSSGQGQYQKVSIPYIGQAPPSGTAYPTAPTTLPGSPGLLDYALLTPRTNLAFTYVSKTTHGLVRTGFLTWDSFALTIADGAVTDFSYVWKTFGDWTTINNGS